MRQPAPQGALNNSGSRASGGSLAPRCRAPALSVSSVKCHLARVSFGTTRGQAGAEALQMAGSSATSEGRVRRAPAKSALHQVMLPALV